MTLDELIEILENRKPGKTLLESGLKENDLRKIFRIWYFLNIYHTEYEVAE